MLISVLGLFSMNSQIQAQSGEHILPTNENIVICGAKYSKITAEGMEFIRFSEAVLALPQVVLVQRARTTSGVRVLFRTASPTVKVHFQFREKDENRGSNFGVYIDNQWVKSFDFPKEQKKITLELANPTQGKTITYDIALPSWSNPILSGIDLEPGQSLIKLEEPPKKVYIALGDSITHGTGQASASFKTYPYQLAEKLNYELYNLAIGGSQITPQISAQIKDWRQVDLITLLIGYNDWMSGKTAEDYKKQIDEQIQMIRSNHPLVKFFCIRPLYTKSAKSKKSDIPLEKFREAITDVVTKRQQAGDTNLFVINADEFTSEKYLGGDPVHLGTIGAKLLAEDLYPRILPLLSTEKSSL